MSLNYPFWGQPQLVPCAYNYERVSRSHMQTHEDNQRPFYVSAPKLAKILSLSRTTIWRLTKSGVLRPAIRYGRILRYNVEEAKAALSAAE